MERFSSRAALLLVALALLPSAGCVGLIANVLYNGHMVPAEFPELKGKRAAVVCVAESGDFGPNPNATLLARYVGRLLARNVKDIDVADHQQIEAWLDEHDVEEVDYLGIGKGVEADYVVVIELENLRLQESQTLYKGQADYALKVVDVADRGKVVFAPFVRPLIYPRISGLHTASVTEREFRQKFMEVLATDVAEHFYPHDLNNQIAIDTPDLSRGR